MKSLKLYYDLISQPSRALYIFFEANQIPYIPVAISLRKGEHLKEDFKKINPLQKLPCIDDNGFKLSQTGAIVRYLTREKLIAENWYPHDSQKRAEIDEYIDWHQSNLRLGSLLYFRSKFLSPLTTGKTDEAKVKNAEEILIKSLDTYENVWLKDKQKYLFGNYLSIADLMAATEIEQPRISGFDPLHGRSKIDKWLKNVKSTLHPYYEEAHTVIEELANNSLKEEKTALKAKRN